MAIELARKGITVNALAPGYILTDMMKNYPKEYLDEITAKIPVQKWAEPEDIAYWVGVVASPAGVVHDRRRHRLQRRLVHVRRR